MTPHVFPVNVLKGVFIELRLKELFQMVSIHQPDWTAVPGSTKKKDLTYKNVFILECVFNGLSNPNKLSSICSMQVNCIALPLEPLKDGDGYFKCGIRNMFSLGLQAETKSTLRGYFIAV